MLAGRDSVPRAGQTVCLPEAFSAGVRFRLVWMQAQMFTAQMQFSGTHCHLQCAVTVDAYAAVLSAQMLPREESSNCTNGTAPTRDYGLNCIKAPFELHSSSSIKLREIFAELWYMLKQWDTRIASCFVFMPHRDLRNHADLSAEMNFSVSKYPFS